MKYFLDTEFIEGVQESFIKPTIDLISIGIYCQDGREYYAISKDFNLEEAWEREWIRENVLKPIWIELGTKYSIKVSKKNDSSVMWGISPTGWKEFTKALFRTGDLDKFFTRENLADLINVYGKHNQDIAKEIEIFTYRKIANLPLTTEKENEVEFYGYYCDYDWVVFCWLFGYMIDLPKGFPMYCIDLKQELDRLAYQVRVHEVVNDYTFKQRLNKLKNHPDYPKQQNEHNALADAKWNYELFNFLKNL